MALIFLACLLGASASAAPSVEPPEPCPGCVVLTAEQAERVLAYIKAQAAAIEQLQAKLEQRGCI